MLVGCAWLGILPASTDQGSLRRKLKTPFYGSRKMKAWLLGEGYPVMRLMGLEAIYRRPNTSKPAPGHRIYPYLLKGVEVNRVDQVWAADITYIPMAQGFLYLVAIMDWHSRHVLAETLQHHGHRILYGGVGGSSRQGPTGDIQHRSGGAVHQ